MSQEPDGCAGPDSRGVAPKRQRSRAASRQVALLDDPDNALLSEALQSATIACLEVTNGLEASGAEIVTVAVRRVKSLWL